MKRKILFSPLALIALIVLGVGVAGAAIFFGGEGRTGDVSLQKGLVGWWKMDGNAKDSSPNVNHGTVTGATLTTDRKGTANKAYSFNGSTDYIDVGAASVLQPAATGELTIGAWVKRLDGDRCEVISKSTTNNDAYQLTIDNNADDKVGVDINSAGSWFYSNSTVPNDGNWYHLVAVAKGGAYVDIYINGVLDKHTTTTDQFQQNSASLLIGKSARLGTTCNGIIDDVRSYDRALSSTEIMATYQEYGSGGSLVVSDLQKGLIGQWKFDGNAKDSSPNVNHGAVSGAVLTTDRKGAISQAYSFNGSSSVITVPNFGTQIPTSEITIAVWAKPAVGSANDDLIGTDPFEPGGGSNRMNIHFPWGAAIYWQFGKPLSGPTVALDASWVGAWGHYVFTASIANNSMKIYRNGVSVASPVGFTTPYDSTTQATLRIGGRASSPFQGDMDDLRIYNRALSQAEITALYQEYNPGMVVSDLQKGLVGNWKLDGNYKDSTPNVNHGTGTTSNGCASGHTDNGNGTCTATLIPPNKDTYIRGAAPTTNYDGAGEGIVVYPGPTSWHWSLLEFPLTGLPAGVNITSSTLSLYVVSNTMVGHTINAYRLKRTDWVENQATWNIYKTGSSWGTAGLDSTNDYTTTDGASAVVPSGTSVWMDWNVLAQIQYAQTNNIAAEFFMRDDANNYQDHGVHFNSKEVYSSGGITTRPKLTVTYVKPNTDRKGQINKAANFNGTSDYIDAGSAVALGERTFSFWMKALPSSSWRGVLGFAGIGSSAGLSIGTIATYGSNSLLYLQANNYQYFNSGSYIDGNWHHWVVYVAGSEIADIDNAALFIDGNAISKSSKVNTGTPTTWSNFIIGKNGYGYFDNAIDDVRIYNRALTPTEITALYQSY